MRVLLFCLLLFVPLLLCSQKMAIGGYLSSSYGNIIVNKNEEYNLIFNEGFQPILKVGGGLMFNYYKKRWQLNTGLSFKNSGAFKNLPITTVNEPEGNGSFSKTIYSIYTVTVPLGINYALVDNDKFKLYGGVILENGVVLNKQVVIKDKDFDYKNYLKLDKGYYLGIMPEFKMEWYVSSKSFVFSNFGLSYQLNSFEKSFSFPVSHIETFKINNLFIDIGFGYRLNN